MIRFLSMNLSCLKRRVYTKSFIIIFGTLLMISSCEIGARSYAANNSDQHENKDNPVVVWNKVVSDIGLKEKLSPIKFSRVYTLVHVAIYDSLLASKNERDNVALDDSLYVFSIAEAASGVLVHLFPNYSDDILTVKSIQTNKVQNYDNIVKEKGLLQGHKAALAVINYAKLDNSDLPWNNTVPKLGKCVWNGTNPVNPMAGSWKTYILKSGSEIQPIRPKECGSDADLLDVMQSYEAWKHRTPEQIIAVHFWGDKPPPVIWNTLLDERIQNTNMSIFDAAYAGAYLNVGMYDAFVSCWAAKYDYWTARPFQRIANLTPEIPTPNFPGYPSGHSVISAVAGRVLGELFPNEQDQFRNMSVEAGLSRLWAGIHFKQDITNGMDQGNKIAEKVVDDMQKTPHPFIYQWTPPISHSTLG